MNHLEHQSRKLLWLLCLIIVWAACTPANQGGIETVTPEAPVATIEVVATAAITPPMTATPTAEPHPTEPPTIEPSPTPIPTEVSTRLITDEPIFTGGDLRFQGWSPNGRYLTYFEHTEEQVSAAQVQGLRGTYPGTGEIVDVFQFEGYESGYALYSFLSPDEAWIAVQMTEPRSGYGRALFVVPTQ